MAKADLTSTTRTLQPVARRKRRGRRINPRSPLALGDTEEVERVVLADIICIPEMVFGLSQLLKSTRNCVGVSPSDLNRLTVTTGTRNSMEANLHTMSDLFAQLGLEDDPASIDDFIAAHHPLGEGVTLSRAPFWSATQGTFLKEEIIEDADWAGVIDELNSRLS